MIANYVAVVQLQREAAQLTAMARIVEQKLAALANRDDPSTRQMEDAAAAIYNARHEVLNAAGHLDRILALEVVR